MPSTCASRAAEGERHAVRLQRRGLHRRRRRRVRLGASFRAAHAPLARVSREQHQAAVETVMARLARQPALQLRVGAFQRFGGDHDRAAAHRHRGRRIGDLQPDEVAVLPEQVPGLGRTDDAGQRDVLLRVRIAERQHPPAPQRRGGRRVVRAQLEMEVGIAPRRRRAAPAAAEAHFAHFLLLHERQLHRLAVDLHHQRPALHFRRLEARAGAASEQYRSDDGEPQGEGSKHVHRDSSAGPSGSTRFAAGTGQSEQSTSKRPWRAFPGRHPSRATARAEGRKALYSPRRSIFPFRPARLS